MQLPIVACSLPRSLVCCFVVIRSLTRDEFQLTNCILLVSFGALYSSVSLYDICIFKFYCQLSVVDFSLAFVIVFIANETSEFVMA